jgi:hypothetical protein
VRLVAQTCRHRGHHCCHVTVTGNRWDSFYPVWARAEHRWYPTGRFAAYNKYVGENIDELTVKPPPGVRAATEGMGQQPLLLPGLSNSSAFSLPRQGMASFSAMFSVHMSHVLA